MASLYILHKLRRDAAKSFREPARLFAVAIVLMMAGVCPIDRCGARSIGQNPSRARAERRSSFTPVGTRIGARLPDRGLPFSPPR
jgi:hypothetical protein